jgi:hypothetical protein
MIHYEQKREWMEGMAKYAERSLGMLAGNSVTYEPVPEIRNDPDFKNFSGMEKFWKMQLDEVNNIGNRSGETQVYYGGMARALLPDRLSPGWKSRLWEPDVWLETLLRDRIRARS